MNMLHVPQSLNDPRYHRLEHCRPLGAEHCQDGSGAPELLGDSPIKNKIKFLMPERDIILFIILKGIIDLEVFMIA